jgi:hypothetical protein
MSDSGAPPRQQSIDYVARLLRMNPIHQGDSIIRARNELLRLETGESVAAEAIVSRQQARDYRMEALEKLNLVRAAFWALPPADLNVQLDALENLAFDDLKRAARRLQIVARHRETFLTLMGSPPVETEFADALKEVLVRSPRDTVMLREHVLDTFGIRARRKAARQTLRTVKAKLPAVYELEAEWYESLCRRKAASFSLASIGRRERRNTKLGYVVICVLFGMIGGAFVVHNDSVQKKEKANKPYVSDPFNRTYQSEPPIERPQSESKNVSHEPPPFSNKKIWQPYPMPGTEPEPEPGIPYSAPYQQLTRPGDGRPNRPANKVDDRYSR